MIVRAIENGDDELIKRVSMDERSEALLSSATEVSYE